MANNFVRDGIFLKCQRTRCIWQFVSGNRGQMVGLEFCVDNCDKRRRAEGKRESAMLGAGEKRERGLRSEVAVVPGLNGLLGGLLPCVVPAAGENVRVGTVLAYIFCRLWGQALVCF